MGIYDHLTRIFQDIFDDQQVVATPELTAHDVDEWTSLTHIRVIVSIEDNFGIRFSAAEISNLENVGEMVRLIESKIS